MLKAERSYCQACRLVYMLQCVLRKLYAAGLHWAHKVECLVLIFAYRCRDTTAQAVDAHVWLCHLMSLCNKSVLFP